MANPTEECIYSRLAVDPDLSDIIDMFVGEMPDRIATLTEQLESSNWEGLRQTAHQLKGAAGSYGFDLISPSAARLESAVRDGQSEQRIQETVNELIALCRRIRTGAKPKNVN